MAQPLIQADIQTMSIGRTLLHTRSVEFRGFRRDDGLWDIEGTLRDLRDYDTLVPEKEVLPAGSPVHHMEVTLTVDDQLEVQSVGTGMQATPFRSCTEIEDSLRAMIGARMGPGWRHAVNERLGGTRSCTHLRELVINMATAALQTIPTWHAQENKRRGLDPHAGARPHYLGQCHAWRLDGPVVRVHHPRFHQPPSLAGDKPAKE